MDPQDAGRVEFRIVGLEESQTRRWPRRRGREWQWPTVAVVAVLWVAGALPGPGQGAASGAADAARRDPGAVVRGDRVLILADNSGSMYEQDGALIRLRDFHAASLRRQHAVVEATVLTPGWALRGADGNLSLVAPLEQALARQAEVDAIYFLSDFAYADDQVSDVEGRSRLWRLLRGRGIRLYVASVDQPVPAAYVRMADQSGGSVLRQRIAD